MGEWKAGEFVASSPQANGPTLRTRVAGWIKPPFAIDYRLLEDENGEVGGGWAVTHIPTGFCAQKLECSLPTAMEIADRIRAMGTWDFTDLAECKQYRDPMLAMRKTLGSIDCSHDDCIGPLGSMGLPQ